MLDSPSKISLTAFVDELYADFPRLLTQHPRGLTFSTIQEEYGESLTRVKAVLLALQRRSLVTQYRTLSGTFLFILHDYVVPIKHAELSDVQGQMLTYLTSLTPPPKLIQTNYTELARHLDCSFGGAKSAIIRLQSLNLVQIDKPSQRGRQNQLLLHVQAQEPALH